MVRRVSRFTAVSRTGLAVQGIASQSLKSWTGSVFHSARAKPGQDLRNGAPVSIAIITSLTCSDAFQIFWMANESTALNRYSRYT